MANPYTHCRRCRRPILLAEAWKVDYICEKCQLIIPSTVATAVSLYATKKREREQAERTSLIRKEDIYFIVIGILGLIGLYLLVVV
jgi:PHP family Zn ribbon phosphoesterase